MTHHLSAAYLKRLLQFSEQYCQIPAMAKPFLEGHSGQRVHVNVLSALMDSLSARTQDPAFGLRFGLSLDTHAFGFLGYLAQVAPDLQHAMEVLVRYEILASSVGTAHFQCDKKICELQWHPHTNAISPLVTDAFIAGWYACASQITGKPLPLLTVHRRGILAPAVQQQYEQMWQSNLITGQTYDALIFSSDILKLPSRYADPVMYESLLQESERLRRLLSHQTDIIMQTQSLIIDSVRQGAVPSLHEVATRLAIKPFKLQRLLKAENSSFSKVVDEAKYSLACEWLARSAMPLSCISEKLGFSEPSAFYRAFKRWTGVQPKVYRNQFGIKT